jgi:hypothetical protein
VRFVAGVELVRARSPGPPSCLREIWTSPIVDGVLQLVLVDIRRTAPPSVSCHHDQRCAVNASRVAVGMPRTGYRPGLPTANVGFVNHQQDRPSDSPPSFRNDLQGVRVVRHVGCASWNLWTITMLRFDESVAFCRSCAVLVMCVTFAGQLGRDHSWSSGPSDGDQAEQVARSSHMRSCDATTIVRPCQPCVCQMTPIDLQASCRLQPVDDLEHGGTAGAADNLAHLAHVHEDCAATCQRRLLANMPGWQSAASTPRVGVVAYLSG